MPDEATPTPPTISGQPTQPRGRRWLLTALGGAAAGFTASKLGQPGSARAANGDNFKLGNDNEARDTTKLTITEGGDQIGFEVFHQAIPGGLALGNTAILGTGLGLVGAGVKGVSNVVGVLGEADVAGVRGTSGERWGVLGVTRGSAGGGPAFPAAGGRFETTVSDSIGTHAKVEDFGSGNLTGSIALLAEAPQGNIAAKFIGPVQFLGNLDVVGGFDLDGTFTARSAPGGGPAARFEGPTEFAGDVALAGSIVVDGTITQSITPVGGGAPVQAYAVQALDSWLEDFGEEPMAGHKDLRVTLPASFVAVADVANYMVFVTGVGGDTPQVTSKDPTGFSLRAQNANKAPDSICYRVVARPR